MAKGNTKKASEKEATIKITAKVDGFRRAGMVHTGTKTYPVNTFTAAQLKSLEAEPLLHIEYVGEPEQQAGNADDAVAEQGTAAAQERTEQPSQIDDVKGK